MLDEMKAAAIATVDENALLYTEVADRIWDDPELSLKEYGAAALYCEKLRALGFAVTEKLCGIETAFCGSFGSGRPVIGILGEFDALSGLSQKAGAAAHDPLEPGGAGHGCGHNLLGAGSLAAAAAVKAWLERSGMPGTVIYYGCPGEEGGAAKAFMAREGLWKQLDAALCWHPGDANQTMSGTNNSCIQVLYKFHGVAAHAAADPFNGRSALDAVELMNVGVQFLREHMTDDCRIHYAITDTGGVSPNVVQADASVLYMVRANKVADSVALQARVDDIAKGAALMTCTTFERVFIDGTAELVPNFTIEKALYDNLCAIGVPHYDDEDWALASALRKTYPGSGIMSIDSIHADPAIAKQVRALSENGTRAINDFIPPLFSSTAFFPGSTDVGDVSWLTPTSQIVTVCWPAGVPGHSWQIVACGKSALAHKGMLLAGKVLAATAIDLLHDAELLAAAKAEFAERTESGYVCPIEPDAVPIAL
ncbi:MAG: amidohydrolase [Oscillospiraceae bacterium]|nr:amidohydrolase [Oscillospiraceae bacterium]